MKFTTSLFLFIMMLGAVSAQNKQSFPAAGFTVNCPCKLFVNEEFISLASQHGSVDLKAYVCAYDEDSYQNGAIYNINIHDLTSEKRKLAKDELYNSMHLIHYKSSLRAAGISFKETKMLGVNAIEYNFSQLDLPTKAVYFVHGDQAYLLQVGSRTNLNSRFHLFSESFQLNK